MQEKVPDLNKQLKAKVADTREQMLGAMWWGAIQRLPRRVEGLEFLESLQPVIEKKSVISIYNHLAIYDSLLMLDVISKKIDASAVNFTIPTSIKFWDGRIGFPGAQGVMEKLRNERRIDFVKVVQHYDDKYSREEKKATNENMINHLTWVLGQPGSIVPFSPEGGRSKTGKMGYAQKGIERIMKAIPDEMLVLPTAIWGSEKVSPYGSIIPRPFHMTHMRFLEPISSRAVVNEAKELNVNPGDLLMLRLTDALPREYWGVYNETNFPGWFER